MTNYILQNERPSAEVDGDDEQSIFGQAIGRGFDLIQKILVVLLKALVKPQALMQLKITAQKWLKKMRKS